MDPKAVLDSRNSSFCDAIQDMTDHRGVDIVLNSLVGDLARASWDLCASFGRFVDISKRDFVNGGRLPMNPFLRSTEYHALDMADLWYSEDESRRNIIKE